MSGLSALVSGVSLGRHIESGAASRICLSDHDSSRILSHSSCQCRMSWLQHGLRMSASPMTLVWLADDLGEPGARRA